MFGLYNAHFSKSMHFSEYPAELQKYEVKVIWLRSRTRESGIPISLSFIEAFCKILNFDQIYCSNSLIIKGAEKLYFMDYSRVVIILFSTASNKSKFSIYSFGKLGYRLSVFLEFFVCSMFWIRFDQSFRCYFYFFSHLIKAIC